MSRDRGLIVLLMDVALIFCCNFVIFLSDLFVENVQLFNLLMHIGLLTVCVLVFQLALRTYNTLWRYAESREYLSLLGGMSLGFALYAAVNLLMGMNPVWISGALTGTALALLAMLAYRFIYRIYRRRVNSIPQMRQSYAAIVGGGAAGAALLSELNDHVYGRFKPYCIIDDSAEKRDKRIHGIPVLGPIDQIGDLLGDTPVTDIIMAIQNLTPERRREILELCAATGRRVHVLGDPVTAVDPQSGGRYTPTVREVEIEDLLGRQPVMLDNPRIAAFIRGKTVLVTGGGGSIGSELCRQIAKYHPKQLIILDIYENNAYDIQQELRRVWGDRLNLRVEIASVRDKEKVYSLFRMYRPDIVLHAAAHKHVPLMEECPEEAIKNNIFGTYHVVRAAEKFGVKKFVMISTDKAVNPTNFMGATKRFCEMILQSRTDSPTEFCAVRFGNVLGSNGSVVPLFKKQIQEGGPVTITDRRIIRYFMTIPEAAQLVLEAGAMAKRNEIFVLDMGEPVKILELAENLIRLSGLELDKDITIQEIGLRPGEKLYEELLMRSETLSKTSNEKIFIEQQQDISKDVIMDDLLRLDEAVTRDIPPQDLITMLREMVPTYTSPEEINGRATAEVS